VAHNPSEQTLPDSHVIPQPPQLKRSLRRFTQVPAQFDCPSPQVVAQSPKEQTLPDSQTLPQAPQLNRSVRVSVHSPLQTSTHSPGHCAHAGETTKHASKPHTEKHNRFVICHELQIFLKPINFLETTSPINAANNASASFNNASRPISMSG